MKTETVRIKNYELQDYVDAMLQMGMEFYEVKKYVVEQACKVLGRHVMKCNDIFENSKGECIFEFIIEKEER